MQQNLSLFHYFKVNRRRQLAGWGDYYQLFPGQLSTSFLQPKRQEGKEVPVTSRLNQGISWLAFHMAVGSEWLFPLLPRMLKEFPGWSHPQQAWPRSIIPLPALSNWSLDFCARGGCSPAPRLQHRPDLRRGWQVATTLSKAFWDSYLLKLLHS